MGVNAKMKGGIVRKAATLSLAFVTAVSFVPISHTTAAYADAPTSIVATSTAVALDYEDPTGTVTGGDEITAEGVYQIASGATGTITVSANATLVGYGSTEQFKGLTLDVADDVTLTIRDFFAAQSTSNNTSTINFKGDGTLLTEGTNLIDNDGGLNAAVIHVAKGYTVNFGSTEEDAPTDGILYGYKSALCSYIGGNNGEANGTINFLSENWFIKGTKTGAVIGGDSTTEKGDPINISGGQLYIKGVARGALIGGSNQGISGDVTISGGLIELFEDFTGPAIGAGNTANAGSLTVTGGSIKTVESSNSHNSKGEAATFQGLPSVSWGAVKATNASDYALLPVDVSSVEDDEITVGVDDNDSFYTGPKYSYVTNEVKNPTAAATSSAISGYDTTANWLANDASWHRTLEDYLENTDSAYPSSSGAYLAPENNIYLALSKETHTVTLDGVTTTYNWDETAGAFVEQGKPAQDDEGNYLITTAEEMTWFANKVNAGQTEMNAILSADVDMSSVTDFAGIGTSTNAYAGTFDGDGYTITVAINTTAGYTGLFGKTASTATVENLTVSGTITTTTSSDYVGVVAYNMGTINNVTSDATISASSAYNVGGICGFNDGGYNAQIGTSATGGLGTVTACITTGDITGYQKVGGICGENAGTIDSCLAFGKVDGTNTSNKNGVGGIAGRNGNNNAALEHGVINACAFYGTVGRSGQKWVGGIAGFAAGTYGNSAAEPCEVTNCYMAGTLVAGAGRDNAIIGQVDDSNVIATNNYATSTSGNTGSSEAEIGILTTGEALQTKAMATALSQGSASWNFAAEGSAVDVILTAKGFAGYTVPVAFVEKAIIKQPVDASALVGAKVTLSVTVKGVVESYQWQHSKDGVKWSTTSWSDTNELSFTMKDSLNDRQWRCVVTYADDGTTETSEVATTTVAQPAGTITTQPADVSAYAGDTATLSVGTSGEVASYQWQHSADGSKWSTSSWSTTGELSFAMKESLNNRQWRVVVTFADGHSETSDVATSTLLANPGITVTPEAAAAGDAVTVSIQAVEGATYQWQHSKDGVKWNNTKWTGYDTNELSFKMVSSLNNRQWRCKITQADGTVVYSEIGTTTLIQ